MSKGHLLKSRSSKGLSTAGLMELGRPIAFPVVERPSKALGNMGVVQSAEGEKEELNKAQVKSPTMNMCKRTTLLKRLI